MGLNLLPVAKARPGHDAEWLGLVEPVLRGKPVSEADLERFHAISISPAETIGAPVIGRDPEADAWLFADRGVTDPEERRRLVEAYAGGPVFDLVASEGLPAFSNGGLYDGADPTSFRGAFLSSCLDVLDQPTIDRAWESMFPDQALAYGRLLVAAAERAAPQGPRPPPKLRGFFATLFKGKAEPPMPFDDQREIVGSAGRWYVFWAERGHPIQAWF